MHFCHIHRNYFIIQVFFDNFISERTLYPFHRLRLSCHKKHIFNRYKNNMSSVQNPTASTATSSSTRRSPRFVNVPGWAPKRDKYINLGKPIARWLRQLNLAMVMLKTTRTPDELISAIKEDEDMLRFCTIVDDLRKVNINLLNGKILLNETDTFDDVHSAILAPRLLALRARIEAADNLRPSERQTIFPPPTSPMAIKCVSLWKSENCFHESMEIFHTLIIRLQKFYAKRDRIDFNSPPIRKYNKSLAHIRIELHENICEFLKSFLPDVIEENE